MLGAQRNFVLIAVLVQAFLGFCWIPVAGHLSDRIGRKRMYMIGSIFSGIFGFIYPKPRSISLPSSDFISRAATASPLAFVDTVFCAQELGLSATKLPKCTESTTLDLTVLVARIQVKAGKTKLTWNPDSGVTEADFMEWTKTHR